jgi:hypothetical protein
MRSRSAAASALVSLRRAVRHRLHDGSQDRPRRRLATQRAQQ